MALTPSTYLRLTAADIPRRTSCELHEHLLDVVDVVALLGRSIGVVEAVGETGGDELEPGLVEGFAGGGDLGHDVAAFAAVGQHLLDAADLALDPAEPLEEVVNGLFGQVHGAFST